jgi:hypothetical protein
MVVAKFSKFNVFLHRDVKCKDLTLSGCEDSFIKLKDVGQHLSLVHGFTIVPDGVDFITYRVPWVSCGGNIWGASLVAKDGFLFKLHHYQCTTLHCFWVTILGSTEQARWFQYKVIIRKIDKYTKQTVSFVTGI